VTRIERFAEEAAQDREAAIASLRNDLALAQGPIVEELPGRDELLVTFVFESAADELQIACELWPHDMTNPAISVPMTRVDGTDVWYASVEADPRSSVVYQFQVDPPSLGATMQEAHAALANPDNLAEYALRLFASGRADPYNPERHYPFSGLMGGDPNGDSPSDKWESVLTLPAAERFPYFDGDPPRGRIERHVFTANGLPGEREVGVYLPHGYTDGVGYPLVVMLDGEFYERCGRIPEVLDGAIAQGAIPPLVAVLWHNATISSRSVEMTCNPLLPDVLADELLPWVRSHYGVTGDAARTVITGQSFGGLASTWIPFRRPDAFGAALIVSPSLWFTPPGVELADDVPGGWLTQEWLLVPEQLPVRLFVSVGTLECKAIPYPGMSGQSMLTLARAFAEAASARGYDVTYREEHGGHNHHTVRRLLVPGLDALMG
jgi:enterochelin esterase family protein